MTKTSSNKWCYEGVILKRSDGFCNVREAAQILGISIATFNRWRKIYPNFPRKRMFSKRTILYSIDELNAWLDRPAIEGGISHKMGRRFLRRGTCTFSSSGTAIYGVSLIHNQLGLDALVDCFKN